MENPNRKVRRIRRIISAKEPQSQSLNENIQSQKTLKPRRFIQRKLQPSSSARRLQQNTQGCYLETSPIRRNGFIDTQARAISGSDALVQVQKSLTQYEKFEILSYEEVYYSGVLSQKQTNQNWDDLQFHYICKPQDHLLFRYEIEEVISKGTFGQVVRCYDHKSRDYVAIKIVRSGKSELTEILILKLLQ